MPEIKQAGPAALTASACRCMGGPAQAQPARVPPPPLSRSSATRHDGFAPAGMGSFAFGPCCFRYPRTARVLDSPFCLGLLAFFADRPSTVPAIEAFSCRRSMEQEGSLTAERYRGSARKAMALLKHAFTVRVWTLQWLMYLHVRIIQ
jgi:hypothetical protein